MLKLKGKVTWATTKRQEKRIEVTEMRMLRWMCGVTRKDKIRNEHIRGTTRVAQASKKITERRLIWYGHVMRRDGEHILRKVLRADIPGKRKRGRPKTRWKDTCQRDLKSTGLRAGEEMDRAMWRRKIISHTGVTVCVCMRFACVIRSGYLVLANQHTSSEGQGSRDLRQTRVEPY